VYGRDSIVCRDADDNDTDEYSTGVNAPPQALDQLGRRCDYGY
jgi:hypothetical protein